MATGRTLNKYSRVYMDGFDLSGHARDIGELDWTYEEAEGTAITDGVVGVLPNQATITPGTLNGLFDDTPTTGLHIVASGADVIRNIMIPIGIRAVPAPGNPVWCSQNEQASYKAGGEGMVAATINFSPWSARGTTLLYSNPWGILIHEDTAETAVNTGTSDHDYGAQTAFGGWMMYQAFSSNGTVTIKVQDAATDSNPSFGDLLTSGVIDPSAAPLSAIVALSNTATVERYTRWQIVLGTATTVTFALAFMRAIR